MQQRSDRKTIRNVAQSVRKWAENLQNRHKMWGDDLRCMCAITSYQIFIKLKKRGFFPTLRLNNDHCFITCNELLIDVTATQFGDYPKVITRKLTLSQMQKHIWDARVFINTREEAVKFFDVNGWPSEQNPFKYKKSIKLMQN